MNLLVERGKLYTKNMVAGESVYGERLVRRKGTEYRQWDPRRSKLAAAVLKGFNVTLGRDSTVLYLGSASGTTVSHVSDIADNGKIYAVDVAPRVMRDLLFLAGKRKNIFPLLFNANLPEEYSNIVEDVDLIYQDVAERNQADILEKNARLFLKKGGMCMIAVKSRSINVSKKPGVVFGEVESQLREHFRVLKKARLEPFEKDHMIFLLVKK
jgi:fibrillarin-like pre-rRNA processing protein